MNKKILRALLISSIIILSSIPISQNSRAGFFTEDEEPDKYTMEVYDNQGRFLNTSYEAVENNLEIEIYEFRSFNENENLDDLDNSIYFEKSQANKVVFKKDGLTSGKIIPNSYLVTSDEKTRKGVYSIRFKLSFNMDGKNFTMKSIGYFSNDELNDASHSDNNEHIVGGYNITKLGVDGILRETSISVKESKSTWPQYVLGAITVILSILAVYFYLKENKN